MAEQQSSVEPGFKDQRVGLVIFGVLGILAATLCFLLCFAIVVGSSLGAEAQPRQPFFAIAQSVGFYLALGIAFAWLGMGSTQCRRWARALILVGAWIWLVMGLFGTAVLISMQGAFGGMLTQAFADAGQKPSPVFITAFKAGLFGFLFVVEILAPAVLVAFYGRRAVRLTCEARDPAPRWTDPIPLPVLAAGLLLGISACGMAMSAFSPAWPLFSILLRGPAASAAVLAMVALLGIAAWGLFRQRLWAWWLGLAVILFMFASFLVYIRTAGMAQYLDAFGFSPSQMKAMQAMPFLTGGACDWLMAFYPVCFVAFMVWVRRHLKPPGQTGA